MSDRYVLRPPVSEDGLRVNQLVESCPPLDENSVYCNLLQCSHFSNTSVIAEQDGQCMGFISGYLLPDRQDTLFIWQVAVSEQARGQGLASQMLDCILNRQQCQEVFFIETTISAVNEASWALFEKLAERYGAELVKKPLFDSEQHFSGLHDTEILARIGPVKTQSELLKNKFA